MWRTIVFDNKPSDGDGTLSSLVLQTYRQSFIAFGMWQCLTWLCLDEDQESVWASTRMIRFLCHLFDPEITITLLRDDLKIVMWYLLITKTRLSDGRDEFGKYYLQLLLFSEVHSKKIARRWLFKTQDDFVGVGSLSVQPSDQVLVILGSPVPLELCPVREGHGYVPSGGEAYLHEFMHGECWTLDGQWKRKCEQKSPY